MEWEAVLTALVILTSLGTLLFNLCSTDVAVVSALTILVTIAEITGTTKLPGPNEAFAGLGNPGLVTIAILFILVKGLSDTGAMTLFVKTLLKKPLGHRNTLSKLALPVLSLSAFLNNTPVVALFIPTVSEIAKKTGISPSKLYLPVAYLATFGGVCTLIGTSTNLLVSGLVQKSSGYQMGLFEISWIGLPCALVACIFLLTIGVGLLPSRSQTGNMFENIREYTVEMELIDGGVLDGKTVDEAGLRGLPGLFLVEVERAGALLGPTSPHLKLLGGDRLIFVGALEHVADLYKIPGLNSAEGKTTELLKDASNDRGLVEVIVSSRCPLIGKTVREAGFRAAYSAVIIALARAGERVREKIGDCTLQAGDELLLEASSDFVTRERNNNHFFFITNLEPCSKPDTGKALISIFLLLFLLLTVGAGWLSLLTASLLISGAMVATKCCSLGQARQSMDWSLIVTIAASLGLGEAVSLSGLSEHLSHTIINAAGSDPWYILIAVYSVTLITTELITNNAAAILVFPIVDELVSSLGLQLLPYAITIAIAASAGFASPFGYQTYMMVYTPGEYKFVDYIRLGAPLDILYFVMTILLVPLVWDLR